MTKFIRSLNSIGLWSAIISLGALVIIAMAEILTREFFGSSLGFASEFSGYLVAFSFFSGSGWALANEGHIKVDLLSDKLNPETAKKLDNLATTIGLLISAGLTYGIIVWAFGTYERASVSYFQTETPLWIPQAIFSLGPLFLTLGLLSRLLNNLGEKK